MQPLRPTLRFGANALEQQADMWLRLATPKITPLSLRKLHISPKPRRQQKEVGEIRMSKKHEIINCGAVIDIKFAQNVA